MFHAMWFLALTLGGTDALSGPGQTDRSQTDRSQTDRSQTDRQATRPLHKLDQAVTVALRNEAIARTETDRREAVLSLIGLYDATGNDGRLETSRRLWELRGKVRRRLKRVERQLVEDLEAAEKSSAERAEVTPPTSGTSENQTSVGLAAFGGRAQVAGNGQMLLDLIQRTIAPDMWDVNGGPATIIYYAPRQVLVVRAPSTVHSRVGRVLTDLRAGAP